jgi:DNA-binding GntR family transcriptional regulator
MDVPYVRHKQRLLYRRVADVLRRQIGEGVYPPGALLPSLPELCAQHHVSDATARHALRWLDDRGIIEVRHGKRSIVLEPQLDPSDSYGQLYADVAVLTRRMGSLSDRIAALRATRSRKQSTRLSERRSS